MCVGLQVFSASRWYYRNGVQEVDLDRWPGALVVVGAAGMEQVAQRESLEGKGTQGQSQNRWVA